MKQSSIRLLYLPSDLRGNSFRLLYLPSAFNNTIIQIPFLDHRDRSVYRVFQDCFSLSSVNVGLRHKNDTTCHFNSPVT